MTSNILPKIELKNSPETEARLFLKFLHHSFHKQQKNIILNSFPELKNKLDDIQNKREEDVINRFISDFYNKNSEKIISIINNDKDVLSQKGECVIRALSKLMDAKWPNRTVIYAIPTILPFSPFQGNVFYYSILARIKEIETGFRTVLYVASHEISHFIFYDTLKEIKFCPILSKTGEHYLKEAIVPAVLNENPLKNILKIEDYYGNPELWNLFINIDGQTSKFTDFVINYYHSHKIEKMESFKKILSKLIEILAPIDDELISKKELWDQYGSKMEKNPEALLLYKKPMFLTIR